ncbi:MAG TPA: DUF6080 domain-containing protein [Vicinamibacterales bacterium]|nr:DUF6080 domain-containing protein [Vicinamibacterales bacterium]
MTEPTSLEASPLARALTLQAWKQDAAWAAVIAVAAGLATWLAFRMLVPALLHVSTFDYWFESDAPAILKQLTDRFAFENERTNRHPLFTLVLYPVVYALDRLAGLGPVPAVGLTYAGLAALWAALFFMLLRLVGLRRIDAGIFTVLALVSASMVFWLPVPETFTPAALTLLVALIAVGWRERAGRLSWIACTLIAAVTLSMTVTNAVAGALVCLVVLGWKRGVTAIGASFALVAAGQFVEHLLFPHSAPFFLPGGEIETSMYVFNPLAGSAGDRLAGFFLHGLLIPPIQQGYTAYMSVQETGLASMPATVLIGWALWLVLLGTGVLGLLRGGPVKLRVVLLGVLASQLALVLVFGQETFLYVLQSVPLLVAVAAFGCLTRFRRAVLVGAVLLAALTAVENGRRFTEAAARLSHRYESARAYAQALNVLTTQAELIVVGLPPAAAYGWTAPAEVGGPRPLTLLPQFDSLPTARRGWHFHYERWSDDALDEMRRAGARYFASQYAYGIRDHETVQRYLDTHGALLERTPDWVIYALRSPTNVAR